MRLALGRIHVLYEDSQMLYAYCVLYTGRYIVPVRSCHAITILYMHEVSSLEYDTNNNYSSRRDTLPRLVCAIALYTIIPYIHTSIHSKRCFIDFYVLLELLSVSNVTMCESDDIIVFR